MLVLLLLLSAFAFSLEVEVRSNYPLKKNNLPSLLKEANPELVLKMLKAIPEIKDAKYRREGDKLVVEVERYPLIKRIEVKGNFFFREDEIKSVLGIEEGMPLMEEKEEVYEELLKTAYMEEGFLNASVKVEIEKNTLGEVFFRVKVSEGNLYFLKEARFEGARSFPPEKLSEEAGLYPGTAFNVYEVQEAEEKVEEFYRREGFFGTFVFLKEVKKEPIKGFFTKVLYPGKGNFFSSLSVGVKNLFTHPLATLKALVGKGRGAVPTYTVYEGKRYDFLFEGNEFFTDEELRRAINFKAVGLDFFLLERMRSSLRELYERKGFLEAKVDYRLEGNKVVFAIEEGPRYRAEVFINGEKLETFYDEEKIKLLVETLLERLRSKGYLDAKAEVEKEVLPKEKKVVVKVKVEKGFRYVLARVKVKGGKEFKEFEEEVNYELPAIFDGKLLEHLYEEIRRRLRAEGYFDGDLKITVRTKRKGDTFFLYYLVEVVKGPRYRYGGELVYGLKKTKMRELSYMLVKEEYFSKEAEELSLWHLIESDVFKSARVESYLDRKNKEVYRLVHVEEKKRGFFELGLGYSTFEKFKYSLGFTFRNLLGIGLINRNYYSKSDLFEIYQFALRDNFLFTRWLFGEGKLFKGYEDHAYFDLYSDGWGLMLGNRITRNLSLAYSLSGFRAKTEGTEPSTDHLKKLSLLFTHRKLFRLTFASAWGDRDYSYAKAEAKVQKDFYHKYGVRLRLFTGALWGNAPIFERYFLGGFKYLKGYDYESIGAPKGGRRVLYLAPEAYYLLKETVEFIGGVEAGKVANDEGKLLKAPYWNLLLSAGIRTPVGLIRADVAYPMRNTALSTGKLRFYISVDVGF